MIGWTCFCAAARTNCNSTVLSVSAKGNPMVCHVVAFHKRLAKAIQEQRKVPFFVLLIRKQCPVCRSCSCLPPNPGHTYHLFLLRVHWLLVSDSDQLKTIQMRGFLVTDLREFWVEISSKASCPLLQVARQEANSYSVKSRIFCHVVKQSALFYIFWLKSSVLPLKTHPKSHESVFCSGQIV